MIPKIIHHITGPKVTPFLEKCIDSWNCLGQHGFTLQKWDDDSIKDFLEAEHGFALEAFLNARNHAEAADIARYLIIYSLGGFYADWDIQLLNPKQFLDLSLKHPKGYMLIDPPNSTLASEYFCAEPGDPYLLNLTKDIVGLYNEKIRDFIGTPQYSGPFRMRDSLKRHPKVNMEIIPVKEVFVYDYREIRKMPLENLKSNVQPMIHYWAHSWLT